MNESESAVKELPFEEVYERLKTAARRERRRLAAGQTLNTTALVHEVYLELSPRMNSNSSPRDFFGYAARAMRNLLIDHARRAARPKHGGNLSKTDLTDGVLTILDVDAVQALDLDQALRKLSSVDARAAEIVDLHYFAGLGLGEIGRLLSISERTVNRDWRAARAWLEQELGG